MYMYPYEVAAGASCIPVLSIVMTEPAYMLPRYNLICFIYGASSPEYHVWKHDRCPSPHRIHITFKVLFH